MRQPFFLCPQSISHVHVSSDPVVVDVLLDQESSRDIDIMNHVSNYSRMEAMEELMDTREGMSPASPYYL